MADAPVWLTPEEYKAWARIADSRDDAAINEAVEAARWAVDVRCGTAWPEDAPVPAPVHYAGLVWANRLMARRNSPEGVIGVGDLGVANIKALDRDIVELLGPWLAVPVA